MANALRPSGQAQSELRRTILATDSEIPVISSAPFNLLANLEIGETNPREFVRCTAKTKRSLLGCSRGIAREEGGSEPRIWLGGTTIRQVEWSDVDIIDYIPTDSQLPAMVGRTFLYQAPDGNTYALNVAVIEGGTYRIDWVNEPPPVGGAADDVDFATPITGRQTVAGVYVDSAGSVYFVGSSTGRTLYKYSNLMAVVLGTDVTSAYPDRFGHIYSMGPTGAIIWTDKYKDYGDSIDTSWKKLFRSTADGVTIVSWGDYQGGTLPLMFNFPLGITGDGSHQWVVEQGNNRIQEIDLQASDLIWYRTIGAAATWGQYNSDRAGGTSLSRVGQISTNLDRQTLYVCDYDNLRIVTVDADNFGWSDLYIGDPPRAMVPGETGYMYVIVDASGVRTLRRISMNTLGASYSVALNANAKHIAFDGTSVYITGDGGLHNITKRLGSTGALQATYGGSGSTDGLFNTPIGIYFASAQTSPAVVASVYVVDYGNNRVQRLRTDTGAFISKITGHGVGNATSFGQVSAVHLDAHSNVYIADSGLDKVHIYNKSHTWLESVPITGGYTSGNAITSLGYGLAVAAGGGIWAIDTAIGQKIIRLLPAIAGSSADGQFRAPTGITIGPLNTHLYVLDAGNGRIQKINKATGAWVATYTLGLGVGQGQIGSTAEGIALDIDGNMWVADTPNNRINVYDPTGVFMQSYGSFGSGPQQLNAPRQISFNTDRTTLYIADSGNGRVMTIRPGAAGAVELGFYAYTWDEEFIGGGSTSGAIGERGWKFNGNGTVAEQASTSANPGLLRLNTGGTSGNNHRLSLGPWLLAQIERMTFIWLPCSNGTTTEVRQGVGIVPNAQAGQLTPTDGLTVEYYAPTAGANMQIARFVGGVATRYDTGIAMLSGASYMAEFVRQTASSVEVTVTHLASGVKFTQLVTGLSTTAQFDACFFQRTTNGIAKTLDTDYWSGEFSGLSRF